MKQVSNCKSLSVISLILFSIAPAIGQSTHAGNPATPPTSTSSANRPDPSTYTIGPGDVLMVSFANSQELNGKVQVGQTGDIPIPLLSTPIHAAGLTPLELSKVISKALDDAKQLRNPYVSIYVEEQNSHFATVLGAVEHPGVFPLVRPTTLLELISMAGGLTTSAGATLTVVHAAYEQNTPPENGKFLKERAITVQLSQLRDNNDPSLNMLIRSGDVVNVSSAPVVYVVGAVGKPGSFVFQDPQSGITVLQALAMAEGLNGVAAGNRSLIIRHIPGQPRQLIQIDVSKLLNGKSEDRELQANDILFVPESQSKKTLQAMARAAEVSAAEITGYGLGLRVAGTK